MPAVRRRLAARARSPIPRCGLGCSPGSRAPALATRRREGTRRRCRARRGRARSRRRQRRSTPIRPGSSSLGRRLQHRRGRLLDLQQRALRRRRHGVPLPDRRHADRRHDRRLRLGRRIRGGRRVRRAHQEALAGQRRRRRLHLRARSRHPQRVTGNKICPAFGTSQRGLAYDPSPTRYYSRLLERRRHPALRRVRERSSTRPTSAIPISGLAFNPVNGRLYALTNHDALLGFDVYVFDTRQPLRGGRRVLRHERRDAGASANGGAGMEIDCDGHLWLVDQRLPRRIYEVETERVRRVRVQRHPVADGEPGGRDGCRARPRSP